MKGKGISKPLYAISPEMEDNVRNMITLNARGPCYKRKKGPPLHTSPWKNYKESGVYDFGNATSRCSSSLSFPSPHRPEAPVRGLCWWVSMNDSVRSCEKEREDFAVWLA